MAIPLSMLKPDENGMVRIKSHKNCWAKFTDIVPIEKAVIHIREGSAFALDEYTIVKLHTQKQMKQLVLNRDNKKCHYCGNVGTTVDHIKPRSKGGCTTPANLVACCRSCNVKKGSIDYNEFIKLIEKEK